MSRISLSSRRDFILSSALGAGVLAASAAADDKSEKSKTGEATAKSKPKGNASKSEPVELAPPDKQPPELELPKIVERKVGWAIVGLGKLALEEVMPAFGECKYSKPVALVSGHPQKARHVADAYGLDPKHIYNYENYDELVRNEEVEAIYIVLPNNMHAEYTIRGFKAKKHVLCEKPMAVTVKECEQMIAAAESAERKLMIAYRLQYEPFNQQVIEWCRDKKLGRIKLFYSSHCQDVPAPNIRLSKKLGGGPVGDLGVYCINAARYVTGEEPTAVTAVNYSSDDSRFREVPESVMFTLQFPSGVLAHCDCSFGSAANRQYRVVCEKGTIDMDPAFSYHGLELRINEGQGPQKMTLEPVNHFAAEMDHFSRCIREKREPRTPGAEGLADMRIVVAVEEAAESCRVVMI